ncbi:hypothetical protein JX265_007550 [Neoarthrinium moseri]|uniref:CsbD-like domain-containing protein n=1 Tax=Neoarthrinium moseri TaxID=1658444 RepID=A0A9P9WJS7_9PEZI|nr:uncharacterized protein JN550_000036 [Neoarthrinium moseri]KAI1854580.1 hypothetical protein JX266_000698 [Neoarthrinium moseri]KAI1866974.1 hypothetical protein JX265_007550 [Neoarthrinium moseri]KAI1877854.1 hypothetical protein JN550_000036 [Neoarthrinium moseri]
MSQNSNTQQPSLVGGHAEYVKGAAQATIGDLTGSHAWKSSGEQAKAHGADVMKAASETRDPATQGFGKVEEVAGKVTGCEGMVKEGTASKKPE